MSERKAQFIEDVVFTITCALGLGIVWFSFIV